MSLFGSGHKYADSSDEETHPTPASAPYNNGSQMNMATDLRPLLFLLSSAFSDLKVKCGSSIFKVHCCIVCPQSAFFEGAMRGQFKEASSGEITIEDDPLVAGKMFDYLYRVDYDDCPGLINEKEASNTPELMGTLVNEPGAPPMTEGTGEFDFSSVPAPAAKETRACINAKMYVIADKYGIDGLKILSSRKFESSLELEWKDMELIPVVEYVYGPDRPTVSELRVVISRFATQHLSTLKELQQFHDTLKEYPEFMYDLSKLMMEKVVDQEKQLCEKHSTSESLFKPFTSFKSHTFQVGSYSSRNPFCGACNRSFIDKKSLRQHDIDSHHWCTDCKQTFRSLQKARNHCINYHRGF